MKAWRLVLPPEALLIVAGGINAENTKSYLDVGVNGFGMTSAFFAPGMPAGEVKEKATRFMAVIKA